MVELHLILKIAENTKIKMKVHFSLIFEFFVVGYLRYDVANVCYD
jgi:hypothetical protein